MKPRQLRYSRQIAQDPDTGLWWYRCCRGHDLVRSAVSLRDLERIKREHEELHIEAAPSDISLGEVCDVFLSRMEGLSEEGRRSPDTLRHYEAAIKWLALGFNRECSAVVLGRDPMRVRTYIRWRFSKSGTGGARIVKEVKALSTILEFAGVPVVWRPRHFIEDIRPKHREKTDMDIETARTLLTAMEPDSVEFAFLRIKAGTGLRNVEVYNLTVGDVSEKTLRVIRRSKRKSFIDVLPIEGELATLLHKLAAERPPTEALLVLEGRRLCQSSLRKRLLAVSKKAWPDGSKVVTSLGWVRSAVVTAAMKKTRSPYVVQAGIGHLSVKTTEGYNRDDGMKSKRKFVGAIESLLSAESK